MKQYIVDAFTDKVFKGNPAAIIVLNQEIKDELMQSIAIENNLSETAFLVKENDHYNLRWFTPGGEIDLCGHATLASAFVLFQFYEKEKTSLTFKTKSGNLIVTKEDDLYVMDMPVYHLKQVDVTIDMEEAIGSKVLEAWMDRDLICVLGNEKKVIEANPDMNKVKELDGLLLHITAKGSQYDIVSRSFAPKLNVIEDPVCGSGHCHLVPLWKEKLHKDKLVAFQSSKRSGVLFCKLKGNRVYMAGKAALYLQGEIMIKE